jgi:hypothetical protein
MNSLPLSVRQLSNRYKTQASACRRQSHEFHTLASLSQRLLLSPGETLNEVSAGRLLALDSRNGSHLFSSTSLDSIRNRTVDFIARSIVTELSRRGCDEETMLLACQRAFDKQFDLSRGRAENVIQFDQNDDDHTVRNAALLAGAAGAGYLGYRYLKNRRPGQTRLPGGPGGDGSYIDVTPKPNLPPGGNAFDPYTERHPAPRSGDMLTTASPAPNIARQTAGQTVNGDLLSQAVRKGKAAISEKGSALLKALRGLPL